MARYELILPKMGESVACATITSWLKEVGDVIEQDEPVVEIATDKVDSEVPSEVKGILVEKLFDTNDEILVGQAIAIIETKQEPIENMIEKDFGNLKEKSTTDQSDNFKNIEKIDSSGRFYSPLVRNIAKEEGISIKELSLIIGTGKHGRVTKNDILEYISSGSKKAIDNFDLDNTSKSSKDNFQTDLKNTFDLNRDDQIVEISRMGKLIAHHMIESKSISAHVQSFIEIDVTNIVNWRNKIKDEFEKKEGEKLTFTPIFMQAVAKVIKEFPLINISVRGDQIIKRANVNLGMATALDDGSLIVPVIKNANELNLVGMAKQVNDLSKRARQRKLNPDDIKGGTYTVTNVGSFGSVFGTPIINQPQVAILALGAIRKMPAVIETPEGDFIGIRQKMFVSHSYDHRVVNGALGGMFIKRLKDILEAWDTSLDIY